ncbi:MAG: hypothetical protein AAGC78_12300 [Cellvibrio sp.]|uniref:hypothetical protein n=1 Tax=Cellvibrio sp. TaxID=1965322 RepID=UPI0031A1088D
MEVSISPTQDIAIASRKVALEPMPAVSSEASSTPVSTPAPAPANNPAVIVAISRPIDPPAVYQEPTTVSTYVRETGYKGAAASAASQAMVHSLNQVAEKKTKFTVSSLFGQIGALSRETSEYRNEARQFQVPAKVAIEKFTPDFGNSSGSRLESAFLNIRTRDGDSIKIQLSRVSNGGQGLEFSFVVDGKLSEQEQKAIGALAEKLGVMGDEFFRTDTTELRGIKDIDTDVISHFSFKLERPDPKTDSYVSHSYDFNFDEVAQTQSLNATDVEGYSVDVSMQLQTMVKGNNAESEVLKQYLDLINRAGEDGKSPNASKRFMLDAFESMFSSFLSVTSEQLDKSTNRTDTTLMAFDSGLPDFKAAFRSPVYHNPGNRGQVESMMLTLEQKTTVEKNGENKLIKQESSYDFSNSYFQGYPGKLLEHLGGNYTYVTEHKTGSVSRMLSMTNDVVNNLWIEQDASKDEKKTRYQNYQVVDEDVSSYSDRRLQEFSELLKRYNGNNQHSAVEELLMSSKDQLFLKI